MMLLFLLACTPTDPDTALIKAVNDAVVARLSSEEAYRTIQAPTFLNTLDPQARDRLQFVDIASDPAHAPLPTGFRNAHALIFWERPIEEQNPMLIGLQWGASGQSTVIYGELYPP